MVRNDNDEDDVDNDDGVDDYDADDNDYGWLAIWLYRRGYTLPHCEPSVANLVGTLNPQPSQSNVR